MQGGNSTTTQTIIITGFGMSGTSALDDLVKEYEGTQSIGLEFRLLTDPDGLLSMENTITGVWSIYQMDMAVKRFRHLVKMLASKYTKEYFYWTNFNQTLGSEFEDICNDFIDDLCEFAFRGDWFRTRRPGLILGQVANGFFRGRKIFGARFEKRMASEVNVIPPLEVEEYRAKARHFMTRLTKLVTKGAPATHLLIDEPGACLQSIKALEYFDHSKLFIVYRDPRDTFALSRGRKNFIPKDVDQFIKWYRYQAIESSRHLPNDRVMQIQFEDIILNYESTKAKVEDFVGLDPKAHLRPKTTLIPEKSAKKIGSWQRSPEPELIEKIRQALPEFCLDLSQYQFP